MLPLTLVACRAIGEGFPHVSSFISFASWYSAEIAPQLRDRLAAFKAPGGANIIMAVLQVRVSMLRSGGYFGWGLVHSNCSLFNHMWVPLIASCSRL